MALIDWNDSFSTGIAQIDEEHKTLVAMINQLYDAAVEGRGSEALARVLSGLVSYTQSHFGTEETLMSLHGYPEADSHIRLHQDLTHRVLSVQRDFELGVGTLELKVLYFLKEWLFSHIRGDDRELGAFLASKGVS